MQQVFNSKLIGDFHSWLIAQGKATLLINARWIMQLLLWIEIKSEFYISIHGQMLKMPPVRHDFSA